MTAVLTRPAPAPAAPAPVSQQRPVAAAVTPRPRPVDMVDEWGMQSFPASDPPSNW